jgi:hypothetical protein
MVPFTPALRPSADGPADRCSTPLRDVGLVAEMIRTGALFGDLSPERWLDRLERWEDRR